MTMAMVMRCSIVILKILVSSLKRYLFIFHHVILISLVILLSFIYILLAIFFLISGVDASPTLLMSYFYFI